MGKIKRRDDKGRIITIPLVERFWDKVDKIGDELACWEWKGYIASNGYGTLIEYKNSEYVKSHLAHRLSYEFNKGKIPIGLVVCHKCDNRSCVNPNHLFIGTQSDNMKDMVNKGRQVINSSKGSKNGSSKLTETQVKEIRERYKPRIYTRKMLAEEYGVSVALIQKIVNNQLWTHV